MNIYQKVVSGERKSLKASLNQRAYAFYVFFYDKSFLKKSQQN